MRLTIVLISVLLSIPAIAQAPMPDVRMPDFSTQSTLQQGQQIQRQIDRLDDWKNKVNVDQPQVKAATPRAEAAACPQGYYRDAQGNCR
jgi:hypothetical protein